MYPCIDVNRVGIGLCVLRMLEIFSGEREPEVEGDSSCVCFLPKAELKVHVFLNVGHQRGCEVVTWGTYQNTSEEKELRWVLRLSGTSTTSKDL